MFAAHIFAKFKTTVSCPGHQAGLLVAVFHGYLMSQLWVGNFFNSYPYISDDGFDWITQGVAFVQLMNGSDDTVWPVLRNPVFVLIGAVDYVVGVPGLIFLVAQCAAVWICAFVLVKYGLSKGLNRIVCLSVVAAWFFSILGFYRLWVLSDSLASSLMTLSVILLLSRLQRSQTQGKPEKLREYWGCISVTVLAALTQTYGLIPMLCICSVYAALRLLKCRPSSVSLMPLAVMLTSAFAFFFVKYLWELLIPHGMTPSQFGLIEFSFGMADFYTNVWILSFALLLPALAIGVRDRIGHGLYANAEPLAILGTVGAFAVLSFLYQWPESRMTFIYLPLVFLLIISWFPAPNLDEVRPRSFSGNFRNSTLFVVCVTSAAFGLLFQPGDYWRPSIAATKFSPGSSWVSAAIFDAPLDRFDLQVYCNGMNDFCEFADAGPQSSSYRQTMHAEYRRRMSIDD